MLIGLINVEVPPSKSTDIYAHAKMLSNGLNYGRM